MKHVYFDSDLNTIVRYERDYETNSINLFCIEDLIDVTVARPRNKKRALDYVIDHYVGYLVDSDWLNVHFVPYNKLKQVMEALHEQRFFSLTMFEMFMEW